MLKISTAQRFCRKSFSNVERITKLLLFLNLYGSCYSCALYDGYYGVLCHWINCLKYIYLIMNHVYYVCNTVWNYLLLLAFTI